MRKSCHHLFRRYSSSKEPLPFLSSPARDYKYFDMKAIGGSGRSPFYRIMIGTGLLCVLGYFCFFFDDGSNDSNGNNTVNKGRSAVNDSSHSSDEKEAKPSKT